MDNVVEKPKNKGGRPRKNPLPETGPDSGPVSQPPKKPSAPEFYAGYRVADGFAWITIFPTETYKKGTWTGPWLCGDGVPIYVPRGYNVCLPMAVVNNIQDALVPTKEDDLTDRQNPVRSTIYTTRFPYSDPIPASWAEFKAFRDKQETLIHPNDAKKKK